MATIVPPVLKTLRLGRRSYPVVLPSPRDPRLHLAGVLLLLQALGQAVLGFEVSVAQILVSLLTCAALEAGISFAQRQTIIWPASALMTGNSVALILRVPGTVHGDWWSLNGVWIFVLTSAVSLLSKYTLRVRGRHVFNPSNLGLLVAFLALGSLRVNPQDLWWGPMSAGLALTVAVIVGGGLMTVLRLRLLGIVLSFTVGFALCVVVIASTGHCITARWSVDPVCGAQYGWVLTTSPEILVFTFFMITDPRTAPEGAVARVVYGFAVAFAAALLAAPWHTEFTTKVAVLGGLTAVCALRPALERRFPAVGADDDRLPTWIRAIVVAPSRGRRRRMGVAAAALAGLGLAAGLLVIIPRVAGSLPADPASPVAAAGASEVPTPRVAPGRVVVPPVTFSQGVRDFDPSMSAATARRMAHDLVEDLVVEGDALRQRSLGLAVTAAVGTALDGLRHAIASAPVGSTPGVPVYWIARATVVATHDAGNPQSPLRLGLEVHGTITRPGDRASGLDEVFVLVLDGGHYLVAGDHPPP